MTSAVIPSARPRSKKTLCLVIAAAVLASVTSACNGEPTEKRFAESVCATILPRALEVLDTLDEVIHKRAAPGPQARVSLWAFAVRGTEITRKLRAELKAVSRPDTDDGRAAAGYLDSIARSAHERIAAEERRSQNLPESITLVQSIRGLNRLQDVFSGAYAQIASYDYIGAAMPEFEEAFEEADSCAELDALKAVPPR